MQEMGVDRNQQLLKHLGAHPHAGALETPFVASKKTGSVDLGRMPPLTDARTGIEYPSGPVHLHEGNTHYGSIKIKNTHKNELDITGHEDNPAGLIESIMEDQNKKFAWDDRNKSILVIKPSAGKSSEILAAELVYDPANNYYSVKSAGKWDNRTFKNKRELKVDLAKPNSATRTDTSDLHAESVNLAPGDQGDSDLGSHR